MAARLHSESYERHQTCLGSSAAMRHWQGHAWHHERGHLATSAQRNTPQIGKSRTIRFTGRFFGVPEFLCWPCQPKHAIEAATAQREQKVRRKQKAADDRQAAGRAAPAARQLTTEVLAALGETGFPGSEKLTTRPRRFLGPKEQARAYMVYATTTRKEARAEFYDEGIEHFLTTNGQPVLNGLLPDRDQDPLKVAAGLYRFAAQTKLLLPVPAVICRCQQWPEAWGGPHWEPGMDA